MNLDKEIVVKAKEIRNSQAWLNEAAFGLKQMAPYLETLVPGSRVLEVGSGPALLLAHITKHYPNLDITGLEPLGRGFATLKKFHRCFLADEVDLRLCGYQEFSPEKGFDLIYLINVFEHLPNWQDFLVFVRQNLNKGGVCVVLAPNYGFPYESHFRLPIIINKRLTYKIFKDYIDRFEKENDFTGLWDSLNFVKWSKVKKTCDELNLSAKFEKEILEKIILRLETDKQFQKRQRFVGMIAKGLYKFRLLKLLQLPFFHAISPYMKFEISHL